jgi:hypothetical protein
MQKFRQIGALSLLTLLLVKAMIVPAIFFNYELRKDYIIQNFCVNKDRPELKCDGQCYLAKQIKAAQQQDENKATATFVDKLLVLDCLPEITQWSFDSNTFSFEDVVSLKKLQNLNGENISIAIFHPPQYVS